MRATLTHSLCGSQAKAESRLEQTIRSLLPIALLLAILAVNVLCSLSDGTGDPTVVAAFPHTTLMRQRTHTADDSASGEEATTFRLTLEQDGKASVVFLNRSFSAFLYKEWVKSGLTYYYLSGSSSPRGTAQQDAAEQLCALRIIQPSTRSYDGCPKTWAWILRRGTSQAAWSFWCTLMDDGSTTHGSGSIDYELESAEVRARFEKHGSWSLRKTLSGQELVLTDDTETITIDFLR